MVSALLVSVFAVDAISLALPGSGALSCNLVLSQALRLITTAAKKMKGFIKIFNLIFKIRE
jgi:hypothetical protein